MIPTLAELPTHPKRIILHWTAGSYTPNATDLRAYHYVISGKGKVHEGMHPVAANMVQVGSAAPYAKHTAGMNSYSVGVAFAGMAGAQEKGPYGQFPLLRDQVIAGCTFVAELCHAWDLPVTPETVHTHAEAHWRHGVAQRGKWDIDVLPWAPHLTREEVADTLRQWIRDSMPIAIVEPPTIHPPSVPRIWTSADPDARPLPRVTPPVIEPEALPVIRLGILDRLTGWLRTKL
jgi:hypothetical protein